jgi:hypothetical protein
MVNWIVEFSTPDGQFSESGGKVVNVVIKINSKAQCCYIGGEEVEPTIKSPKMQFRELGRIGNGMLKLVHSLKLVRVRGRVVRRELWPVTRESSLREGGIDVTELNLYSFRWVRVGGHATGGIHLSVEEK